MKNLRVIYDNAADRATLAVTQVVAALGSENLKSDDKFKVCRGTGKQMTITATWPTAEILRGVAIPFSNLSSTATIRIRAYAANGTTVIYDSGAVLACPAPSIKLRGWTAAASASAYGYGGGASVSKWFASVSTSKLVLDISDDSNTQGYVEFGRLVVGDYWEPEQGAEQGATVTSVEDGKHFRTAAGNLLTEPGIKYKKQSLPLARLNIKDRSDFWNILVGNGMTTPMFISVHPGSSDLALERMHQMYGKLVTTPVMSTPYFDAHSATIEIEEV